MIMFIFHEFLFEILFIMIVFLRNKFLLESGGSGCLLLVTSIFVKLILFLELIVGTLLLSYWICT